MTLWTPQQSTALSRVEEWRVAPSTPWYYLGGYAGTGKTTLAKTIAESARHPIFATVTGKAASVMRSKGCVGARTISSLIHNPKDKSSARLRELERYLALVNEKYEALKYDMERADEFTAVALDLKSTEDNIKIEKENLKRPSFSLKDDSDLAFADLLVLDEVSMVDQQLGEDLLSFGVPILALGDPFQLPPVAGSAFFTAKDPDYMLTDVVRQALDSPVLQIATRIRNGEIVYPGQYGDSRVGGRPSPEEVLAADQIIVGRNATRRSSNKRVRELRGYQERSPYPLEGERVMCLRNNKDLGLYNGAIYVVQRDASVYSDCVILVVVPEEGGEPIQCSVHKEHFLNRGEEISQFSRRSHEEFDFGYCVTVHKSQASEWENVVFFSNDWNGDHADRHRYTGVTRASKRIRMVL